MNWKQYGYAWFFALLLCGAAPIALNGGSSLFDGGSITLQLLGPSGTAAQPTYSFSTDNNSGVYRQGADQLGWSTNGSSTYSAWMQGTANGSEFAWMSTAGLLPGGPALLGSTTTDNGLGHANRVEYWNNGAITAWLEGDATSAQFCFGNPATATKPCLSPESTSNGVLRFLNPSNLGWSGYVDVDSGYIRSTNNSIGFSFGADTDTGFLNSTFSDEGKVNAGGFGVFYWSANEIYPDPSQAYAFHITSGAGDPTAGDCDADAERGRLYLDTTNSKFYVCGGATRLWDHIVLTDVP
jgi:hypothetical protein